MSQVALHTDRKRTQWQKSKKKVEKEDLPQYIEDAEDIFAVADALRQVVAIDRRKRTHNSKAYWVQEKVGKSPARIKVSLSRPLSASERIYFNDSIARHSFVSHDGSLTTGIMAWEPFTGMYNWDSRPFRVRLSRNEQIYAESNVMGSVRLFDQIVKLLEDYFVNIHPTAVKTLREWNEH